MAFLEHALERFAERGIQVQRIMTTTAPATSAAPPPRLAKHGLRHLRTRPYTPRTNGKAEALIGILLREWAYAYIWHSSSHRARALTGYLRWYNNHRPHGTTGAHPSAALTGSEGPAASPDQPVRSREARLFLRCGSTISRGQAVTHGDRRRLAACVRSELAQHR